MAKHPRAGIGVALGALQQAGAHFRAGRYMAAAEIYRDVIRKRPKLPDLHNNLGIALKAAGHVSEAIPCFRRAIRLKPDYVAAHANLASSLEAQGKPVDAIEHRVDAWRLDPDNIDQRDALIIALRRCPFQKPNAPARSALSGLFERTDLDKQALAGAAIRLWRTIPAVEKTLAAAGKGYPKAAEPGRGFQPLSTFLADPLIVSALSWAVAVDPDLEAAIVFTRRDLLKTLVAGETPKIDADWLPALALQARIAEWVWPETELDRLNLTKLDAGIDILAEEKEPNRARIMVRAMFRPVETDPIAAILRTRASKLPYAETLPEDEPEPLWSTLLRRSFLHPHTETTLSEDIRNLTPIADDTSARVRSQYEESPYPRWLSVDQRPPRSLQTHLSRVLPSSPIGPVDNPSPRILIAGCGTGRHAIQTALRYQGADVTAVDLSRTSLAYAKRMAQDLQVRNIAFYQGDILALDRIPNRFDLIESSGVLHHLADPMVGWRKLQGLLRPDGLMRLAFYSRRARAPFEDIRAAIPPGAPLKDRVDAARAAVFALPEDHPGRALLRTADFYATSGVRDALLHEQESTVDLIWLEAALVELNLRFLGFELPDPAWLVEYRRRRPEDAAGLDLRAWDSVETEHPSLFLGMYQFWVRPE
jgi:SAM-dependent methyltransferase/tetratricopeptide (TPR) repeat protein